MRTIFSVLILFAVPLFSLAQTDQKEFKEYSYSELFQMIEEEEDSVFTLNNAIIRYDVEKDSLFNNHAPNRWMFSNLFTRTDTIFIDKELNFNSVFLRY